MNLKPYETLQSIEDLVFSCKGDRSLHRFTDIQERFDLKRDPMHQHLNEANCDLRRFYPWCYTKLGALWLRNGTCDTVSEVMKKLNYSDDRFYPTFKYYYGATPGFIKRCSLRPKMWQRSTYFVRGYGTIYAASAGQ
ncbi:MAG: hypothetical protein IPP77_11270 [Bacteroidetes bacterium]|nr:hypothetical protein [Bacteroidota bacterium]